MAAAATAATARATPPAQRGHPQRVRSNISSTIHRRTQPRCPTAKAVQRGPTRPGPGRAAAPSRPRPARRSARTGTSSANARVAATVSRKLSERSGIRTDYPASVRRMRLRSVAVGGARARRRTAPPRRCAPRGSPSPAAVPSVGQRDQRGPPVGRIRPPLDQPALLAARRPPRWPSAARSAGARPARPAACGPCRDSTPSARALRRRDVPRRQRLPGLVPQPAGHAPEHLGEASRPLRSAREYRSSGYRCSLMLR